MKWWWICSILVINSVVFSQIPLPAYKDGNWNILNGTSNIQLEKGIESVGNFDSKKCAFIIKNGLYGIIDSNGNQLVKPTFHSIKSLGFGLFYCVDGSKSKILDITTKESVIQEFNAASNLNKMFVLVHKDSFQYLIHKGSKTITKYPDSLVFDNSQLNTVLIETDSIRSHFHDSTGKLCVIETDSIEYFSEYILLKQKDKTILITRKIDYSFNSKISNVDISENFLSFYDGKSTHLLDLETGEEIIKLPFQKIVPCYFGGYFVSKNNKTGWIDKDFQLKIPPKYDNIQKSGNNYEVRENDFCGLYDSSFNMVIPCEFQYFTLYEKFTKVYSVVNTVGLFSNLTHQMLLSPVYDKIVINRNLIKAYLDNMIRIIELSDDHNIKSDLILNNAITANQNTAFIDPNFKYDKRLLALGWFFDTEVIGNPENEIVKYRHKWGLHDPKDSMLITPKYKELIYLPNIQYTLVNTGIKKYKLQIGEDYRQIYQLKNHKNGRTFGNYEIVEIDTIDCYNRSYVRFECTNGYKILFAGDSVRSVNYISSSYKKYLNYCTGGKPVFFEKSKESVALNHISLNGKKTNSLWYFDENTNTRMNQVIYKGAKWNYLDTNGENLFSQPFEFADEFFRNSAIVKRKTGWGVVNSDSIIVPLKFSDVVRLAEFQDTVFKVKLDHGRKIYLNVEAEPIQANLSLVKAEDKLALVKLKDGLTIYSDGVIIAEKLANAKLLNQNTFVVRRKKEFHIFDSLGRELSSLSRKPETFLNENFIVCSASSKSALLDLNGDTVISSGKQEFTSKGEFIECKTLDEVKLYDQDLNLLYQTKQDEQLFVDAFANQFAISVRNKILIYSEEGKCIKKFKKPVDSEIDMFQNNLFICKDAIFTESECIKLSVDDKIAPLEGGFVGINQGQYKTKIFFNSLTENTVELNGYKVKYLGEDVFCYRTKKGLVLRNSEKEIVLGPNSRAIDRYNDGFCLVRVGNEYFFLTSDLKNPFNRSFQNASPFKNNLTTIQDDGGWTIMDATGLLKSVPTYNRIEQISDKFFETTEKSTYGLYDNHGNEILAPIYEKITVISTDIIQVVKNGEIGYFNSKGKVIFSLQ